MILLLAEALAVGIDSQFGLWYICSTSGIAWIIGYLNSISEPQATALASMVLYSGLGVDCRRVVRAAELGECHGE